MDTQKDRQTSIHKHTGEQGGREADIQRHIHTYIQTDTHRHTYNTYRQTYIQKD